MRVDKKQLLYATMKQIINKAEAYRLRNLISVGNYVNKYLRENFRESYDCSNNDNCFSVTQELECQVIRFAVMF